MIDLHYDTHGTGDTLGLIHSGGTDSRNWQFTAPELAENHGILTTGCYD